MHPLVTVGLPVYNGMPYLPETVKSLLNQTHAEFEVLIINDGSTDGTAQYLQTIADSRFRIVHQENRGLTATLNRMLEEVPAQWLIRQDADDIAYPNRIQEIVKQIARYPDAGMFYSFADYYPKAASIGTFRTTVADPEALRDLTGAGHLLAICHPTVCLNVTKTRKLGGYRFNLFVEDIDLWWRMALEYDIRLIPEALLGFRQNEHSISQSKLEEQTVNTLYIQYLLISHLWKQCPLPYEKAIGVLGSLVDRKQLRFRETIREANIAVGNRHWVSGACKAITALFASPRHFFGRIADEFGGGKPIVNGIKPHLFALYAERLWPGNLP